MAIYKGTQDKKADEVKYEVIEKCGVLGERSNGFALELRLVAWNGNEPKYDIRAWKETDEGEKMQKGVTLTGEELESLYEVIKGMVE